MSTYIAENVKELVVTTPVESATPPSELNDSDREIKRVFKNQFAIATKTANYTLLSSDHIILANGTFNITLPTASDVAGSGYKKQYTIINIGTGIATIVGTVDGVSNPTIPTKYSSMTIETDGSAFYSNCNHIPDIQNGRLVYAVASGTGTYIATLSPAITQYAIGAHYFISFTNANPITNPTLNLNSVGAITIVKEGTKSLIEGDIPAGHKGILLYDGTYLVLLNPALPTVSAGMGMDFYGVTAPAGWLFADSKTIGDASSGGTARANADAETLFALLWDATANTELIIQDSSGNPTTRGASASADFAAHKRMPLPDKRGRVSVAKDNMGGTSADRVTSAQADLVCGNAGEETHALSVAELPAHDHGAAGAHDHTIGYYSSGGENVSITTQGNGSATLETTSSAGSHTHTSVGSGTAHNNMSPYLVCNYIIKY